MGCPKGCNNGGRGVKGRSGRKSVYQEQQVAEKLKAAFIDGFDLEVVDKILNRLKIKKGKINYTDLALAKALKSDSTLIALLKKIVPDKVKLEGTLEHRPIKIEIVNPASAEKKK